MGYVQSGKTANITGVLARAIDSGYRLVIVMTGDHRFCSENRRSARIDMELVGVENILRDRRPRRPRDDEFRRLSGRSGLGPGSSVTVCCRRVRTVRTSIRLTNHRFDYRSLRAGITALEFEKYDNSLPLNDRSNLDRCSARLVVVKKNASVLRRLVRDLKSIRPRLLEIPALLIDDESDLASVNTTNPNRWLQATGRNGPQSTA